MRTIPILTVAAIASTGTAYYFLRDNASAKRAEEAKPSIGSASYVDVQDTPIRGGRRDQPANPEQPQLTFLKEKVAALEARLRYIETAASEQPKNEAVSGPDKPVSNNGAEKAKAKKFSEADLGHWMDEALDAGYFDRDATPLAMDQVETSLAKVPGINLADIQCSERFCRATLIPETGKRLNISQLMGVSPFIGSGTTIHEPDGSVRFYFTQPGQSLSELRSEAQKAAFGDIHLK
jgi:hypothetical protein